MVPVQLSPLYLMPPWKPSRQPNLTSRSTEHHCCHLKTSYWPQTSTNSSASASSIPSSQLLCTMVVRIFAAFERSCTKTSLCLSIRLHSTRVKYTSCLQWTSTNHWPPAMLKWLTPSWRNSSRTHQTHHSWNKSSSSRVINSLSSNWEQLVSYSDIVRHQIVMAEWRTEYLTRRKGREMT